MHRAAYTKFKLEQPVTGVLVAVSQILSNGSGVYRYSLSSALKPMIELEFAFKLQHEVNEPISAANLLHYVGQVSAALEIPDLSFQQPTFLGVDIIANNVLAHRFISPQWQSLNPALLASLDQQSLHLSCAGEQVAKGQGNKALGSQQQALVWMLNHLRQQQFALPKGTVLLSGNLITMTPAKPCVYRADFSAMGQIELEVEL